MCRLEIKSKRPIFPQLVTNSLMIFAKLLSILSYWFWLLICILNAISESFLPSLIVLTGTWLSLAVGPFSKYNFILVMLAMWFWTRQTGCWTWGSSLRNVTTSQFYFFFITTSVRFRTYILIMWLLLRFIDAETPSFWRLRVSTMWGLLSQIYESWH